MTTKSTTVSTPANNSREELVQKKAELLAEMAEVERLEQERERKEAEDKDSVPQPPMPPSPQLRRQQRAWPRKRL
jgi:hypothetical protein